MEKVKIRNIKLHGFSPYKNRQLINELPEKLLHPSVVPAVLRVTGIFRVLILRILTVLPCIRVTAGRREIRLLIRFDGLRHKDHTCDIKKNRIIE